MTIRGGIGEPYCSQACYDEGGRYSAAVMLKNQDGVCGFCQKPVQASMYGASNCAVVPYESVNLFVCPRCSSQARAHLGTYRRCCMCQKAVG